jgi:Protein of unknown function (DUF1588)/Protein of unknown function (DUF1592)/Protein of unknown function (DUF1595)/Protein of unknown function (DUF1585)/Protein of unknown function (DUF1587)
VRKVKWLPAMFAALVLACNGNIGGGSNGQGQPGLPGTGGANAAGGSGSGGVNSGGQTSVPGALAGPSLRLLTEPQYRATLASLFPFASEVAFDLEDDVSLNGLHAIGTSNIALSAKATESYLHAAEVVSERAFGTAANAATSAGCDVAQATCADKFIADFGRRAFRRSLTADERTRFNAIYQAGVTKLASGAAGLKYATTAILTSPYFVYRVELGEPKAGGGRALTGVELASKLAYFLWSGPPDKELLDLAENGGLKAAGAVAAQTTRLLAATQINGGMDALFDDYIGLGGLASVEKLPARFPKFTPALAAAMRQETLMDLGHAALSTQDFRTVFNSSKTYVNADLAALYGVSGVSGSNFVQLDLPAARRGLLGNASILSLYAHADVSSPTLRGKFIRNILMCQSIPPPPPDVDTTLPDESKAKTARERLTIHSTNPTCAGCHQLMDPIGLSLENFDAVGAYRTQDNGETIDASGEIDGVKFTGAAGLADALAQSARVPDCVSRMVFRSAWGRLETPADEGFITDLTAAFAGSTYQMRQLFTSAVTAPSFVNVGELDQ